MEVRKFIPHPALSDLVLSISSVEAGLEPGMNEVTTPYPPTPFQSLMFYCNQPIAMSRGQAKFEIQPLCVVVGPQFSRINIRVFKKLFAIRVDFLPGGLHRLLGISMHELFDEGIDARSLLGPEMSQVEAQLQDICYASDGISIVEAFLLKRIPRAKPLPAFDSAMKILLEHDGNLKIESVAGIACLSLKQFERKCIERIGMTPKMYSRIMRFSKAYRFHESNPALSWTNIAHESGYFDQMHMIRDFREFAGVNPTTIEKELLQSPIRMQQDLG